MSSKQIKILFISVAVLLSGLAIRLHFHPIVTSLTVMSGSISEAEQKNTYICRYGIRRDAPNNEYGLNTPAIIGEVFSEQVHHRKNYGTDSLVKSDSSIWIVVRLDSTCMHNDYRVVGYSGTFPVYRKLHRTPAPDTIDIRIVNETDKLEYLFTKD